MNANELYLMVEAAIILGICRQTEHVTLFIELLPTCSLTLFYSVLILLQAFQLQCSDSAVTRLKKAQLVTSRLELKHTTRRAFTFCQI